MGPIDILHAKKMVYTSSMAADPTSSGSEPSSLSKRDQALIGAALTLNPVTGPALIPLQAACIKEQHHLCNMNELTDTLDKFMDGKNQDGKSRNLSKPSLAKY